MAHEAVALQLQRAQRLAQRGPGDAELVGQRDLAQLRAGSELTWLAGKRGGSPRSTARTSSTTVCSISSVASSE
jgi:hypothetical protein